MGAGERAGGGVLWVLDEKQESELLCSLEGAAGQKSFSKIRGAGNRSLGEIRGQWQIWVNDEAQQMLIDQQSNGNPAKFNL